MEFDMLESKLSIFTIYLRFSMFHIPCQTSLCMRPKSKNPDFITVQAMIVDISNGVGQKTAEIKAMQLTDEKNSYLLEDKGNGLFEAKLNLVKGSICALTTYTITGGVVSDGGNAPDSVAMQSGSINSTHLLDTEQIRNQKCIIIQELGGNLRFEFHAHLQSDVENLSLGLNYNRPDLVTKSKVDEIHELILAENQKLKWFLTKLIDPSIPDEIVAKLISNSGDISDEMLTESQISRLAPIQLACMSTSMTKSTGLPDVLMCMGGWIHNEIRNESLKQNKNEAEIASHYLQTLESYKEQGIDWTKQSKENHDRLMYNITASFETACYKSDICKTGIGAMSINNQVYLNSLMTDIQRSVGDNLHGDIEIKQNMLEDLIKNNMVTKENAEGILKIITGKQRDCEDSAHLIIQRINQCIHFSNLSMEDQFNIIKPLMLQNGYDQATIYENLNKVNSLAKTHAEFLNKMNFAPATGLAGNYKADINAMSNCIEQDSGDSNEESAKIMDAIGRQKLSGHCFVGSRRKNRLVAKFSPGSEFVPGEQMQCAIWKLDEKPSEIHVVEGTSEINVKVGTDMNSIGENVNIAMKLEIPKNASPEDRFLKTQIEAIHQSHISTCDAINLLNNVNQQFVCKKNKIGGSCKILVESAAGMPFYKKLLSTGDALLASIKKKHLQRFEKSDKTLLDLNKFCSKLQIGVDLNNSDADTEFLHLIFSPSKTLINAMKPVSQVLAMRVASAEANENHFRKCSMALSKASGISLPLTKYEWSISKNCMTGNINKIKESNENLESEFILHISSQTAEKLKNIGSINAYWTTNSLKQLVTVSNPTFKA